MRSLSCLTLFLLLAALPLGAQPLSGETSALAKGRTFSQWLHDGEVDSLFAVMAPSFREAVGGREGFSDLVAGFAEQAGAEAEVLREAVYEEGGLVNYYRVGRYAGIPSLTARWVWDASGLILGANLAPTPAPAATDHLDYVTKTPLRLPFEGPWYVAWGGRTPEENYHVVAADQRFAYDFLAVHDGRIFIGEGAANEDYACWDSPVYAPGAGRVVAAVDSVADNAGPGVTNPAAPPGNHVVIDHENGEYSLLAHFRLGSVAVAEGDQVAAGDLIGACGNSGNSSLPHLHYHLQTGPAYGEGVGLPAFFQRYTVDGEPVEQGEPLRGQTVAPEGR